MGMKPEAYLERIGFQGPVRPDPETLERLVGAHLAAVPFENLDQQMGVPVSTDLAGVYEKVVRRRRGGWCFELNGLFGWLLGEFGFDVSMLGGHVGPKRPETAAGGDHMLLRVVCGEAFLVDVGFGGGARAPVPLRPVEVSQPPYDLSITDEDGGWWRYCEAGRDTGGTAAGEYWFTQDPVARDYFSAANQRLQTDPGSSFRRMLKAQRRYRGRHVILRGLVHKTIDETGTVEKVLVDPAALVACLRKDFDLDVPRIADHWPVLKQSHEALFGL